MALAKPVEQISTASIIDTPGPMHHCLQVTEILDLILTDLFESREGPHSRGDLLSVGLTCQDFLEVALDILWGTQTSLVPLIKTLPCNLWKEGGSGFDKTLQLLVEDNLTHGEEARFYFYAKRIRRLNYVPYTWYRISPSDAPPHDLMIIRVLWNIRQNKEVPLFPRLQHVEFSTIQHASLCLDIFLESKQVSLSLYWSHSTDNMDKLVPIIKKHALNMQELDLDSFQGIKRHPAVENYFALSQLVLAMEDLRGLACGPHILNTEAIGYLSSLPHLLKLHLPHNSQEIVAGLEKRHSLTQNKQPFPELQDLFIRETKLSTFATLMRYLLPLQIRKLVVELSNEFSAQDVIQSLTALSMGSSRWTNVHQIAFKQMSTNSRHGHSRKLDETVVINCFVLSPLLNFPNLTTLELDMLCVFDLRDSDITSMADAWPRLRHLRLGPLEGWYMPSGITYSGLLHLLLKCPDLEYLAIVFNPASDIPRDIKQGHINRNITYFYVGNSIPSARRYEPIGKFLATILPCCRGFGGRWQVKQDEVARRRWDSVLTVMRNSQK
ncbi:hypothetical protein JR316_0002714 [Psilocybe cubensis]|uniref:Uncharacterized protein n=2 Tax=Psilocybe cubensis TaxID=181762 RepID=A0ACB8HDA6_PSICU|nr:hypothetical protein JR316_0002714 [Psilocybe cubensis]KAH9485799.1 hypothetical protein JR316_0002714 [Psilocybe cubensis]